MQYWLVSLSYLCPERDDGRRRFRHNAKVGIVAERIKQAIEAAEQLIPEGAEDPKVWCVSHHGRVDKIIKAVDAAGGKW